MCENTLCGILATYPGRCEEGFGRVLLVMSPMGDESSQSAEKHEKYVRDILEVFHKTTNNFVAIVADNCSKNKDLVDRIGCSFIECVSHRFNLAFKRFCDDNDGIIEEFNKLMKKLSSATL